jgi:spectinomycin phosphotransferase
MKKGICVSFLSPLSHVIEKQFLSFCVGSWILRPQIHLLSEQADDDIQKGFFRWFAAVLLFYSHPHFSAQLILSQKVALAKRPYSPLAAWFRRRIRLFRRKSRLQSALMLEPPALSEELIKARLWDEYALRAQRLTFLPLGADVNTAVYRVEVGEADYFLKLRKGDFNEISVAVPDFLHQHGLGTIIAPLAARSGQLWGLLEDYRMILYPFVAGQDGYARSLSPGQWQAFGSAMRAIHAVDLPPELRRRIPSEDFSPRWRKRVRAFQSQVEGGAQVQFNDPIAAQLANFMRGHRAEISRLVERTEQLAALMHSRARPWVLCHGDVHPGNLLLPSADPSALYIVDWDNPLYAPRERDLALVGGTYAWRRAEDIALFYHGYHSGEVDAQVEIDPTALRYYRCERIVVDIAEFCQQLLATTEGGEDRDESYRYFTGIFLPDHELDLALRGDTWA